MRIVYPLVLLLMTVAFSLNAQCPDDHSVFLPDGSTQAFFCENNPAEDILVRSDIRGYPKAYLLVDEVGKILWVSNRARVPIGNLRSGTYRVYSFVYFGRLMKSVGGILGEVPLSTYCWELSNNWITLAVADVFVDGVTYEGGSKEKVLCSGGAQSDTLTLEISGHSGKLMFVLLDDEGRIAEIYTDLPLTTGAGISGSFTLIPIAYEGDITGQVGDLYNLMELVSGCASEADPLTLQREVPDGGQIEFEGTDTSLQLCPHSPSTELVKLEVHSTSIMEYYFFVVNADGTVEKISAQSENDFSGLDEGEYYIYGASAAVDVILTAGDTFDQDGAFSGNCYDWADQPLTLTLENPRGGTLFFEDFPGEVQYFCVGDITDQTEVYSEGNKGPRYAYLLFDGDSLVRDISETGEFEEIPATGEWQIVGLSYFGNLSIAVGDKVFVTMAGEECYDYSENILKLLDGEPVGSEIGWNLPSDSTSFCSGDRNPFTVDFVHHSPSVLPYVYLVLNSDDLIVAKQSGNSVDFEGFPGGLYRIIGVSISDPQALVVGDTFNQGLADCMDISANELQLLSRPIDGGEVFFRGGHRQQMRCERPDEDRKIRIFRNSASPQYLSIITDEENRFIDRSVNDSINIRGLEPGNYRIWGVGFISEMDFADGLSVFDSVWSSDCYALSEEFISLTVDPPEGGAISLDGSPLSLSYCEEEVRDEWIHLESSSTSGLNYSFVVIDPEFRVVEVLDGDSVNLKHFPPGVYNFSGVSYGGNLLLQPGDLVIGPPDQVATDCYEFGNNVVTVTIFEVDGGELTFADGSVNSTACPVMGSGDHEFATVNAVGDHYAFLISDEFGILVDFTEAFNYDFTAFEEGFYYINGLSYTGVLDLEIGMPLDSQNFSTSCFALTEDHIEVRVELPDGGEVMTIDGLTELVIDVETQAPFTVIFDHQSESMVDYRYILTDGNGVVFGIIPQNFLVISAAFLPNIRIYGVSFTGELVLSSGQHIEGAVISDGCYELSSNFIDITIVDDSGIVNDPHRQLSSSLEVVLLSGNPFFQEIEFEVSWNSLRGTRTGQYSLYDVTGQRILKRDFHTKGNAVQFYENAGDLHSGLYLLVVESDGDRQTLKLLKH
nr:T9SS type A sorting domain-containing protein [Saprospiraceae bacterium]